MITAVQNSERRPIARRPLRGNADGSGLRFVIAMLALVAVVAIFALGAGLWLRHSEAQGRIALAAARSESRALKVRQEALRAELFDVARRLEALEPGAPTEPFRDRRLARLERGRGST